MSAADACLAGCCSPFTNCCIGLRNERFFVLWLAGVWAGCLYGATVSWPPFRLCIVQGMMRGVDTLASSDIARCVAMGKMSFIFLPAACLLLFMCALGGWHLLLVLSNQTTIEVWQQRLGPLLSARDAPPAVSYDRGVLNNMREVFWPCALVPFD